MKRVAILLILTLVSVATLLTSCGGYNPPCDPTTTTCTTTAPTGPPSGLTKRVFVANKNATINIVDAQNDLLSFFTVGGVNNPTAFIRGGGKNIIGVLDQTARSVYLIDITTEAITNTITLNGDSDSVALTADGAWAYAALHTLGQVVAINIADVTKNVTFSGLSGARRVVLSHNNGKVLVFRDNSNSISVIDVATNVATTVTVAPFALDAPYSGVFSSDDSKAYILSCGSECGGTTASVSVLDIASATVTSSQPVDAATTGVLDSTGANLYVIGSLSGVGRINIVSTANFATVNHLAAVSLPGGLHTSATVALTSDNKIYIGSTNCTITTSSPNGCLAAFNIGTSTAKPLENFGFVTSVEPISGRSIVYITSGGNLHIYSSSTDSLIVNQPDIIGLAQDARLVDK